MLNELKQITKSQKMRVLLLLMVLAIVTVVVVVAIDGASEYQSYNPHPGYYYEIEGEALPYEEIVRSYGDVYATYGDVYGDDDYYSIEGIFGGFICELAGISGDAPTMMPYVPCD